MPPITFQQISPQSAILANADGQDTHFLCVFAGMKVMLFHLLLALCLLASCALHAHAATRMALLIGNNDYASERKLGNPVNDANMLGGVLKNELGFSDVTVLPNRRAPEIDAALDAFVQRARNAKDLDTLVFYFSGHGIKSKENVNFMLGIEARTGHPDSKGLKWEGVAVDEVRDKFKDLGARVALVILDACRDGPGGKKSGSKGWAKIDGGENLLIAFATEQGMVADDGAGKIGPYAQALANAWRRSDLPILKQFDDVKTEVLRVTGGQKPWREGNLATDVYLLPEKAPKALDLEPSAWALCEKALSELPCTEYLQDFPLGPRSKQARTKLADLKTASVTASTPVPTSAPPAPPRVLKDCDICPELVVIPAGSFLMGDYKSFYREVKPAHTVTLAGFLLGK